MRLDRWHYIAEVRARTCAEKLLTDPEVQKKVVFDLVALAGGPPDPKVKPRPVAALEQYAPSLAKRAEANPTMSAANAPTNITPKTKPVVLRASLRITTPSSSRGIIKRFWSR